MSQLASRILAVSFVVSMLFVAVCACNGTRRAASLSGVASISSLPPDWIAGPLWEPPYRKFEILVLPANHSWPNERSVNGEMCVRPAWGIFAVLVAVFLYYWMYATYGSDSTGLHLVLPLL